MQTVRPVTGDLPEDLFESQISKLGKFNNVGYLVYVRAICGLDALADFVFSLC